MQEKLEALSSACLYLDKFEIVIENQISKIEDGNTKDVYNIIGQMSEGIEWLLSVFKLTEDAQVQKIDIEQIDRIISNIVEALENNDTMLLKDTFEYELMEQLRGWKRDVKVTLEYYNK